MYRNVHLFWWIGYIQNTCIRLVTGTIEVFNGENYDISSQNTCIRLVSGTTDTFLKGYYNTSKQVLIIKMWSNDNQVGTSIIWLEQSNVSSFLSVLA